MPCRDQGPRHRRRVVAASASRSRWTRSGNCAWAGTSRSGHLPYIDRVLDNAFRGEREIIGLHRSGVLASRVQVPCLLELIWSYWHEEGMLVQSIERDRPALPEHPRAGRPRPARASGDRSAAAAQQPAVGLHPGRAEPAHGEAPRLRVRPSVRPDALRQGGAAAAAGGQPLEVPRGVPPPAASLLRSSTRRTTTPR